MTERFNVAREVRNALADTPERALEILPALAGEILASADPVTITDLKDSLGIYVFDRGPNHEIADAVLAMVRTYTINAAARFSR